jgi:hypothetical protein
MLGGGAAQIGLIGCRRIAGLMRSPSIWLSAAATVLRQLGALCPAARGGHWRMDPSAARGGIL